MIDVAELKVQIKAVNPVITRGRVIEVSGPVLRAAITGAAVGDLVSVKIRSAPESTDRLLAQVVGFSKHVAVLSPFFAPRDVLPGAEVEVLGKPPELLLGPHLLGTVVSALGNELYREPNREPNRRSEFDALAKITTSIHQDAPSPFERRPIREPFVTGIRAIDGFLTIGCGQRLSVFAEPGVGKSTLLAMIARNSLADVNVFGLIGERGREVQELLFDTLDAETRGRSVVVVSTSDEVAVSRMQAAYTATRIAEYFRDQGLRVLLQVDSLTRLFRAFREVGLAAGEVPVRRGYPPSVFAAIPGLIERAGNKMQGSITALYTVLLSSDLDEDPMVEEIKGLTDGHLLLTKDLAEKGHFPAIDILGSISRLAPKLQTVEMAVAVQQLRKLYARLVKDKDLMLVVGRADEELENALRIEEALMGFLRQGTDERSAFTQTTDELVDLAASV